MEQALWPEHTYNEATWLSSCGSDDSCSWRLACVCPNHPQPWCHVHRACHPSMSHDNFIAGGWLGPAGGWGDDIKVHVGWCSKSSHALFVDGFFFLCPFLWPGDLPLAIPRRWGELGQPTLSVDFFWTQERLCSVQNVMHPVMPFHALHTRCPHFQLLLALGCRHMLSRSHQLLPRWPVFFTLVLGRDSSLGVWMSVAVFLWCVWLCLYVLCYLFCVREGKVFF